MKAYKLGILASAVLGAMVSTAHAACPADGATPFFAGPVDPASPADPDYNGFASYVEDSQGLALAPCLDPAFCFFDPPVVGNLFSEQIGFGAEAFWWLAESSITTAAGLDALVVMAAEMAFVTEEPADGDQFPFTRLRLRVDVPSPGIYTITHPYGQKAYVLQSAGGRVINDSFDIEFMPNAVNQGRVAPWLTWDTFPTDSLLDALGNDGIADFVGNAATPHAVEGSPCGNNFFRIEAVRLNGTTPVNIDPDDVDGDGSTSSITESLFTVSGRVFPGNVETPLSVGGVSYSRDVNAGRLNVFATAPTTATVTFSGGPNLPMGEIAMSDDGFGRFFGSAVLPLDAGAVTVPTTVQVTATNIAQPNNDTAVRIVAVHDIITLSRADYDNDANTLTIMAASSDQASPPTLTAVGFGDLTGGELMVTRLNVAPATVTLSSSAGGSITAPVRVINP